jgi:LysM domain.
MKWNELDGNQLKRNDILFLESKSSNGNIATYKSQSGESMHDIAQKFGIKLKKLYSKNRMDFGQQPKPGQLIYLQEKNQEDNFGVWSICFAVNFLEPIFLRT